MGMGIERDIKLRKYFYSLLIFPLSLYGQCLLNQDRPKNTATLPFPQKQFEDLDCSSANFTVDQYNKLLSYKFSYIILLSGHGQIQVERKLQSHQGVFPLKDPLQVANSRNQEVRESKSKSSYLLTAAAFQCFIGALTVFID